MKRLLVALCLLLLPVVAVAEDPAPTPAPSRCASALLPRFDTPHIELAALQAPPDVKEEQPWQFKAKKMCSGVNCGCDIEQQQCNEGCNGNLSCLSACAKAYNRCAVCCCCDPSQWCPIYC